MTQPDPTASWRPDRRTLLSAAMAGLMAPSARLVAAPPGAPRLLVVLLRGGYDSMSLLVPRTGFYQESRPGLAIPASGAGGAIALDGDWGLNPVMQPYLMPIWQRKELAFIPYAGTSDVSRSHFHAQDTLEMGGTAGRPGGSRSGFLNRLSAELGAKARPMAFTNRLPLSMAGPVAIANIAPRTTSARADPRRDAQLARLYAHDRELGPRVVQGMEARTEVSAALAREMVTSAAGAADAGSFERTARQIGRLMRDKPNLGFVDVGGWDTHANQRGGLNFHLNALGNGLAGFVEELGARQWASTVVVVMSEFGRTFRQNGSGGTDHGHGTVYWVMGGPVSGGRIAGRQVALSRATLNQDRDLPVLNPMGDVLGGLFQTLYGLDAASIGRICPGAKPAKLALV